jgi:hypothetical protein
VQFSGEWPEALIANGVSGRLTLMSVDVTPTLVITAGTQRT